MSAARLEARRSAPIFAALGDETRLKVVARLCARGPQSITELTEATEVTRQAVTKHLRVLEGAGLAKASKSGRETLWQLEPAPLDEARAFLDLVSSRWDDALSRLKDHVER